MTITIEAERIGEERCRIFTVPVSTNCSVIVISELQSSDSTSSNAPVVHIASTSAPFFEEEEPTWEDAEWQ